jgi:hypothetical protein
MKTDASGGASAGDDLEKRLSGRFTVELEGAERDYPALREKLVGSAPAGHGAPRPWPRIALPLTSAAVLVVAVVAALGLLLGPGTGPSVGPGPHVPSGSASAGVVMGADGIPTQIDGQRVYRVTDQADWQNLSGSFLLGAYAVDALVPCSPPTALPSPEDALLQQCGLVQLVPKAQDNSDYLFNLAPSGFATLTGWLNGPAVVMRVHTHDPVAAGCSADQQAACEAAVVVEAVVWPAVPTQVAGERVYRATDQASFPASGSFLLGGPFAKPQFVPPCPMQPNLTAEEQQLIPYCYILQIDGLELAPMSNIDEPNGEIVVARVHIDDPLAAQCPASDRVQCKTSIVVESVVWRGAAPAAPSPTPGATGSLNPVSAESAGPVASTGSGAVGPDGVPTTLNGEPVFRAANLPTSPIFLLGGKLTRDNACAAPATPLANPPACGYWMIDGVQVGTIVDLPESLLGQPVVAQVEVGRALAVCPGGSCTKSTIVVMAIVWPVSAVATPPAPPTPLLP